MTYYDKDKVEKDTAQSRGMFIKELPKMFGYLLFFYAILGFGIPWRMELPRDVMWSSTKASLFFGATQGGIMLVVGAILMSSYALRKAPYTDFGPASSLTMLWSFRVFAVVGVPLALWNVFHVVLPTVGSAGEKFAQDWWMWLLLVGEVAGWFSGRSVGGLIGLLAIWLSGRRLLKQL
ncbi:MAG: hypothetical protein JRG77_05470 [Deltaproteobacteria bacterium]|nr:hypothetical protein [Deltaproteobacteria bacterium]MBW1966044.1 hypothetical protein [Deltaproteobacteria bacterium]MBW2098246.1 hypothetical protein [Deltaproteobacteria bacterium]